ALARWWLRGGWTTGRGGLWTRAWRPSGPSGRWSPRAARRDRGTRARPPRPPPRGGRPGGGAAPRGLGASVAEQRAPERRREEVVQIEVELRTDADVFPCIGVDRHHRLDADLEVSPRPDDPRIDGAGRVARARAVDGSLERAFDPGKHAMERSRDPHGAPHRPQALRT